MRKWILLSMVLFVCILALTFAYSLSAAENSAGDRVPAGKVSSHKGLFDSKNRDDYGGPSKCASCHKAHEAEDIIAEVMDTVHYKVRGEDNNPTKGFVGGGAHGLFDQPGGTYGSSGLINYAYMVKDKSDGCGACHIGKYQPFLDPVTKKWPEEQRDGVNCLICHAKKYRMDPDGKGKYAEERTLEKDQNGKLVWYQDRSVESAESVGGPVTTENCLRCHDKLMGPDHFGTPYYPYNDVHAAKGLKCTDCHLPKNHKIARGAMTTSMYAWERQDVEVGCRCHGNTPHKEGRGASGKTAKTLNDHGSRISCSTCHVLHTTGVIQRVWAPLKNITSGKYHDIPIYEPDFKSYKPLDVTINDFEFDYKERLWLRELPAKSKRRPDFRWFSGTANFVMESVVNPRKFVYQNRVVTTRDTPGAKIYPFKKFDNGLVMDKRGTKEYFPELYDVKYTMLAFYSTNKDEMIKLGLLRPTGLTPEEELFLSNVPMLITIDKKTYQETGNISQAASMGLGKMSKLLKEGGYNKYTEKELIEYGSRLWSGIFSGFLEPCNRVDPYYTRHVKNDPTKVTGSLFALSHGVAPKKDAVKCQDCHSVNGIIDFEDLGYSPEQSAKLATALDRTTKLTKNASNRK